MLKIYDGIMQGLNEALDKTTKNKIIKGAPLGPRVIEVIPNDDFELLLTFNNGEKRIFDAHQIMYMEAFAPLKNIEFFKLAKVKFGTVVWPRDIDYCPDMLYEQSEPI